MPRIVLQARTNAGVQRTTSWASNSKILAHSRNPLRAQNCHTASSVFAQLGARRGALPAILRQLRLCRGRWVGCGRLKTWSTYNVPPTFMSVRHAAKASREPRGAAERAPKCSGLGIFYWSQAFCSWSPGADEPADASRWCTRPLGSQTQSKT